MHGVRVQMQKFSYSYVFCNSNFPFVLVKYNFGLISSSLDGRYYLISLNKGWKSAEKKRKIVTCSHSYLQSTYLKSQISFLVSDLHFVIKVL